MSKYLAFTDIVFKSEALLVAALATLGYAEVERGEALPLYGYMGDERAERAQLVVRRRHIGPASNDLGFARTAEGYTPIISEYDQRTMMGGKFIAQLRASYNERVVEEMQRRLRGTIRREQQGSTLKLKISYCDDREGKPEMKETTWIIDASTGALTVEGMSESELARTASDLLAAPSHVNCARPVNAPPARRIRERVGCDEPRLRVHRIYHGSVVEGPGRRSVLQLMGCTLRCPGCHTPETHRTDGGVPMGVGEVVDLLLDPEGHPRDGVTILGGEPFLQHENLSLLLKCLKERGLHVTLYSGYTLEELRDRPEPSVREALALADILIDGRFVAPLAHGAGEWRGSTNQRVIYAPGR